MRVVAGLPFRQARPLIDRERRIEHDRGRRESVIQRREIDERLDRRTDLTLGLRRAVELAHLVAEAAGHGEHAPGMRIKRDQRAGNRRKLPQGIKWLLYRLARRRRD